MTAASPLKGVLLMVLATFLFASHDALSKYLMGMYPVLLVIWARYIVHTLLMVAIFIPREGTRILRTRRPGLQALRAACLLGTSLLFISSLQYLPLAEATSINFLAPLLVTALSVPLLGEHVSRGQWIAVLVGFCGVVVIVHPGGDLFTPAALMPLGSATCFCFYQLLTRRVSEVDSSTASNFFAGVFCSLVMSAIVPFVWQPPAMGDIAFMLVLGGCGLGAHLLMTEAFRFAAPALLAPFGYCQIVFAAVLGGLFFHHWPQPVTLVGIAIICASGLAAAWLARRARSA